MAGGDPGADDGEVGQRWIVHRGGFAWCRFGIGRRGGAGAGEEGDEEVLRGGEGEGRDVGEERAVSGDGDGGESSVGVFGIDPGGEDGGRRGLGVWRGDEEVRRVVRDAASAPVHGGPAVDVVPVLGRGESEEGGEFGGAVVEGEDAAAGGNMGAEGGDMPGGEGRGVGEEDKGRGRCPRTPVKKGEVGVGESVEGNAGAGEEAFELRGHLGGEVGLAGGGGVGGADDDYVGGRGKADEGDGDGRGVGIRRAAPEGDADGVGLGGGTGGAFGGEGAEGNAHGAAGALGGKLRRQPAAFGAQVDGDGAHGVGGDSGGELDGDRRWSRAGRDGRTRGERDVDEGAVGIGGG